VSVVSAVFVVSAVRSFAECDSAKRTRVLREDDDGGRGAAGFGSDLDKSTTTGSAGGGRRGVGSEEGGKDGKNV
jgi:hypothetical protein